MKHLLLTGVPGRLAMLAALAVSVPAARAAISFTGIQIWAGAPAGPGVNEAALVFDFHDGLPALIYGYRWPANETRTGRDMFDAVLGTVPGLSADSSFFPNTISFGTRSRSFSDNGTPANYLDDSYWGYWVNNSVYYHPTDYTQNSHIISPATSVVPLGNPYGETTWTESSTGAAARPLADGSWDGWAWGPYGTQPGQPVPEPAAALLLGSAALILKRRRK